MNGYQDREGVNEPATANRRFAEVFDKPITIDVIANDDLTAVAASHEMVDRAGVLEA